MSLHQIEASEFRKQLKQDATHKHCIAFNLQQVQPLPLIKANKTFYHSNTWMYILGIHEMQKKQALVYLWPEIIASRGARKIASCLYKFVKDELRQDSEATTLIGWSDTCGGPNRNFIICSLWLRVLHECPNINTIVPRFPVSGHSFLPNDRDMKKAKKKERCDIHH